MVLKRALSVWSDKSDRSTCRTAYGRSVASHKIPVALARGAAAFLEGPDDEALAAAAIAGGEDARDAGGIFAVVGLDIGAGVALDAEGIEQRLLGAEEAHREQDELGGHDPLAAGDVPRDELALLVLLPLDLDGMDAL